MGMTDVIQDKLAERHNALVNTYTTDDIVDVVDLPMEDLLTLWRKLGKDLSDPNKQKDSNFMITTSNAYYYVTSYLKARVIQEQSDSSILLSIITQAHSLGMKEGFLLKHSKELQRRKIL